MPGVKTNERPGTRAVLRHYRMSATKARQVLDLVRGHDVDRAHEILRATPREGARVVAKVLESAVANARNNDGLDPDELYVSACYADEGVTIKRWRPRARGRATRIRKRTCHITVIVSRLPEDRLTRRRARQAASAGALRSRRVAASRRRAAVEAEETGALDEEAALEAFEIDEEEEGETYEGEEPAEPTDEAVEPDAPAEEDLAQPDEVEPELPEHSAEEVVELHTPAEEDLAEEEADTEEEAPAPARRRRTRATKAADEGQPVLRPKGLRRSRRAEKSEDEEVAEAEEAFEIGDEAVPGEESEE